MEETTKAVVETGKEIVTNGQKQGLIILGTAAGTILAYEGIKWGVKKVKAGIEKAKEKKSKVVEEAPEKTAKKK